MIPIIKVKDLVDQHKSLENDLSSGKIDKKNFAEISKNYSELNEIIEDARAYISFEKEKKDLEKIINDKSADKEMTELGYL